MSISVSESELLDAVREATRSPGVRPEGALTTTEICEATGLCRTLIKERIRALVRAQRMECVWIKEADITGRMIGVPAYRLVAAPKKSAVKKGER